MKILHVLTSINTGGAEKFCVDLCNTQADISDNQIYLCVLDALDEQPLVKMISSNVKLISLNKQGGYSLKIIYRVYKLLSKIDPDIVHFNGRALIYASLPILIKKIPSVYTVHTMANKEYNKYIRYYVRVLFNIFSKYFVPVAIGKTVSKTVQNVYGKQHNRYIYNGSSEIYTTSKLDGVGMSIEQLKKDTNTLVFVSIGRIAPEKNTLLLVEAFNKLLDRDENVCLCIVGYDSSKEQVYMSMCEEINRYADRIQFVGQKNNIADYLYYADASCLTSSYEGLGIAALEAFSMGVPVLSTPSGGPSDIIIDQVNGVVSNETTVESYIEILKHFIEKPLTNKDEITKIYNKNYTMKICAAKYLELYRSKMRANKS